MYSGYSFKLLKNTYYDGPFEARVNSVLYTGTRQCNEDYSKLTLNLGGTGSLDRVRLNRKFKSKSTGSPELIPWFNTDGDRYLKFVLPA